MGKSGVDCVRGRAAGTGALVIALALGIAGCASGEPRGQETRRSPGVRPSTPSAGPSASAAPPAVRVPAGTRAGFVVFDRAAGRVTVSRDAHGTVRSASVVKLLIAVDFLERNRAVSARDRALLRGMLRSSDDRAATVLWNRGGRGAIVSRTARRMGLRDTAPPPASRPGYWGYTALSAADVVEVYRYLLERADARVRGLVLGELRRATRCGRDGFDQYFGIPRAVPRPWAVKQGWSGFGLVPSEPCGAARGDVAGVRPVAVAAPTLGVGRPVLHTTGTVGEGDRWVVAVWTLSPPGTSFAAAASRITALTRQVHRAGTR